MDRDSPDTDAVRRFELYERVLEQLAEEGDADAIRVAGANSILALMRNALINAAVQEGDVLSARIRTAFPQGLDAVALVNRMRVRAVTLRLGGEG